MQTEASLNASALKKKIEDYIALSSAYEKLLKECELFRTDREVFAEAAEDAEERRDEAEKRAVQAEVWAAEAELRAAKAEQKERAATNFIVTLLKSSSKDKLQVTILFGVQFLCCLHSWVPSFCVEFFLLKSSSNSCLLSFFHLIIV